MGVVMGFLEYLRAVFSPYKESTRVTNQNERPLEPITNSGRTSTDSSGAGSGFGGALVVTPPPDYESLWSLQDLDTDNIGTYTVKELVDMMADLSPEISKAIWDFQRLCNPGYEIKVYQLGSEDVIDETAKEYIDGFLYELRRLYGSLDVVIGRLFMGAYLRGAFCAELVLAPGGLAVDLATPDPYSVRFRKIEDSIRGQIWQPGQVQSSDFVPLDIPTFKYLPVDPAPASPYGRSLVAPALFSAIFIVSLLHDVKRVVMQQGYRRLDIKLNLDLAMDNYTFDNQGYSSLAQYIAAAIQQIKNTYAALEPDDAFIHTDMFEIGVPVGTVDSDSIGAIDRIIERLEKMVTRALKTNALVMGTGDNTSESDSNRRWEIHSAGVKSLQHHCENLLESILETSLQAQGMQARVEFRFAELRAAEMFRDEQTRTLRIQNSRAEFEAGYTSQDEASNNAVGHNADVPEPRTQQGAVALVEDNNAGNEVTNRPDQNNAERPLIRWLHNSPDFMSLNDVIGDNTNGASGIKTSP